MPAWPLPTILTAVGRKNLTWTYLTQDNPDLNGWLPDQGGIFYTADMTLFFQTFFKNPQANWRYSVGFEPRTPLMHPR